MLETGSGGDDKSLQEWGSHWGVFVRGGGHRVSFVICVCVVVEREREQRGRRVIVRDGKFGVV